MQHTPEQTNGTADLARGAGLNYLGYLARLGLRAPFLILAGLLYGEEKFGIYTFVVVVLETLAAGTVFGMKSTIFKFMDDSDDPQNLIALNRIVAHALTLTLGLSFISSLLVTSITFFMAATGHYTEWTIPMLILSPVLIFITFSDVALAAIRYRRIVRYEVLARSILEPVTLTLGLVMAHFLGWHSYGLIGAYYVSLAAAAVSSAWFFSKVYDLGACLHTRLSGNQILAMARFSAPTAFFEVLKFLSTRIDILIISWFYPPAIIGIYGMAWQFSTIIKKIRQGFDSMLGPVTSREVKQRNIAGLNEHLATVARWILSIQLPLTLIAFFFGGRLLGLMGERFGQGVLILSLLVLGDVVNGSLSIHEWPLVFLKPGLNPLLTGGTILLNLLLGILSIRLLGPAGMALAILLSYFCVNGIRMGVNIRLFHLYGLKRDIAKPVLAFVVTALALFVSRSWYLDGPSSRISIMIPFTLLVYFITLFSQRLSQKDRLLMAYIRHRLLPKTRRESL